MIKFKNLKESIKNNEILSMFDKRILVKTKDKQVFCVDLINTGDLEFKFRLAVVSLKTNNGEEPLILYVKDVEGWCEIEEEPNEDESDIKEAQAALKEVEQKGSVPLDEMKKLVE